MSRFRAGSNKSGIILAAILAATVMPLGSGQTAFAIPTTVHNVSNCTDLETLGADASTEFDTLNLTADIDCTGISFLPLYSGGFSGTFDGHGHHISNLTVNRPSSQWNGLFANASNATIQNLTLASGTVSGLQFTGSLIGQASSVTISGVTSHVNVISTDTQVGGLIGYLGESSTSLIQDVSDTGNVTVTPSFLGSYIGGLIGGLDANDATSVTIRRASATGHVSVTSNGTYVGGLIGRAFVFGNTGPTNIFIQDSYATGDVTAGSNGSSLGGLIGDADTNGLGAAATITLNRTYATGNVTGSQSVGGLIGQAGPNSNNDFLNITDSFAAGLVTDTGAGNAGLVGANYFTGSPIATSTHNYYDGPGTGQSACASVNALTGDCTQIDTHTQPDYFKGNHSSAPMSAWNFSSVWTTVNGGYPILIPPDDGDGISMADEAAGPNSGDANGDGTADAAQSNVASFPDPVSGHYSVLQTSCGSLFNVQVGAEPTTSGQTDVAYTYPGGLMGFVVTGCTPGTTATITQYFYGLTSPSEYTMRKWDSIRHTYTTIPGAAFSSVTIAGQTTLKAVYRVTDGSSFDQDGTVDGNIQDPAGPGVNVLGVPDTGIGGLSRR